MEIPRKITMAKRINFPQIIPSIPICQRVINISPNYMCLPKQRTNCKLHVSLNWYTSRWYTPIP